MTRNGYITRRNALHNADAVLSGGSWAEVNPLENILDINPQIVAESTGGGSASFAVDFGAEFPIGLIGFAGLRTSSLGTMRVTLSGSDSYDSGLVTTWPESGFAGLIDPDTGNWTLTGVIPEDVYIAMGMTRLFMPASIVRASSMTVDITDSGDEQITIGCVGAYTVWEPSVNFDYDWTIAVGDRSEIVRVPRGATFIDKRGLTRKLSIGFPKRLPEEEFWSQAYDAVVSKGQSEPLWVAPYSDPTESTKWEKAAVYGLMSKDSELANPFFGIYSLALQIDQL